MIKGIIFDFDGVISDSEVLYVDSLVEYLKTVGINSAFDEVKYVIGQNMNDIASCLIRQFDLHLSPEQVIRDSLDVYQKMFSVSMMEPMEGLKEFLERCREKGIRMMVASSSDYSYLYDALDHFGIRDYFEMVISGADFVHSKPDPSIYNTSAERMGIDKKDLMIIEDSPNGIKAGIASGIFTVAFKGSKIVQDTSLADKEVYSFSEIEL
jgi:HAD superfamily hydrolase (TIGR01509 family)